MLRNCYKLTTVQSVQRYLCIYYIYVSLQAFFLAFAILSCLTRNKCYFQSTVYGNYSQGIEGRGEGDGVLIPFPLLFKIIPHPQLLSSLNRLPFPFQIRNSSHDFIESHFSSCGQIPYPAEEFFTFPNPARYSGQITKPQRYPMQCVGIQDTSRPRNLANTVFVHVFLYSFTLFLYFLLLLQLAAPLLDSQLYKTEIEFF